MRRVTGKMLRLADAGWVVLSKNGDGNYEFWGTTPLEEELFGDRYYVERLNDLEELKSKKELSWLREDDYVLVTRVVRGETIGTVLKKKDLDLAVATWNVLRIYSLEGAE